jgi:hypothetical protein
VPLVAISHRMARLVIIGADDAHKSPGSHTKKFAERLAKRRDRNRCRKRLYVPNNNPRKLTKKRKNEDDNEDYGANIHALDIAPEEFLKQKTAFLSSLQKTEKEIIQLSKATVEQTTSNLWFSEPMKRLTASSFGKICKMRATTDPKKTCKTLLQSPFTGNKYTNYGKDHESIARAEFAEVIEKEIGTCGFFVGQNKYFYLGATPDGLIGDEALVEIKCPYSAREDTPTEAIVKKKVKFASFIDNIFKLKRNHDYFYQIQGQFHVTQRQYCYFVFWTPKGILFEKVDRDEQFFANKMQKQLHNFYYNYYADEFLKMQLKN